MRHDAPDLFPDQRVRERVFDDVKRDSNRGGRVALASSLMALCGFFLVWAISAYQVTEPGRATAIIERGIVSITDIDRYLPEVLPGLRDESANAPENVYQLPGYPLPVAVTGEEIALPDEEVRDIVLRRATALVYAEGLDAFSGQESQSFPFLSAENAVHTFVGLLRGSFHDQVGVAVVVLALVVTLSAAIAAASDRRPGVLRTIGGALLAGALAGLALSWAFAILVGRSGGDDVFTSEMAAIAQDIAEVPRRNFFVVSVFSGMLFLGGILLTVLERRYVPGLEGEEEHGHAAAGIVPQFDGAGGLDHEGYEDDEIYDDYDEPPDWPEDAPEWDEGAEPGPPR